MRAVSTPSGGPPAPAAIRQARGQRLVRSPSSHPDTAAPRQVGNLQATHRTRMAQIACHVAACTSPAPRLPSTLMIPYVYPNPDSQLGPQPALAVVVLAGGQRLHHVAQHAAQARLRDAKTGALQAVRERGQRRVARERGRVLPPEQAQQP